MSLLRAKTKTRHIIIALVLTLVLLRTFVLGWHFMTLNSNSNAQDQGGYLSMGIELRESARLSDGIRGPLYSAILSPFASKDWSYFTWSKYMTFGLGMLSVLILFIGAARLFNWKTALVASSLWAININLIQYSIFVLPESLLLLLFMLAWFSMVFALRREKTTYWVLAGLFAGLAYLTKGTGQLLVMVFALSAILVRGVSVLKGKNFWLLIAAYCVIASPLWLYNLVSFGHPTFNYATTYQMWLDDWRDWYNLAQEDLPTAATYIQEHSIEEIIQREWHGVKVLRFVLAKTLYPGRDIGFDKFLLSPWSGVFLGAVVALAIIFFRQMKCYFRRHRPELLVTILLFVTLYALFAWYMQIVSSGIRFMLPMAPILLLFLSDVVVQVFTAIFERIESWPLRSAGIVVLVVGIVFAFRWVPFTAWQRHESLSKNIFQLDAEYNSFGDFPLAWLQGITPQGTVVAQSAVKSLPTWRYVDWFKFVDLADNLDEKGFALFFRENDVKYVIVESEFLRYQELAREKYFKTNADGLIQIDAIPEGWELAMAYPSLPFRWGIFRVHEQCPAEFPVDYSLGDHITLKGYDLSSQLVRPGETLSLSLHWYFDQPTDKDLTVFTQLLGPDYLLHGQKDNPPLEGQIRTSEMPAPGYLVDLYEIVVSEDAPLGTYQLLVGMYESASGERVSVESNTESLPDNAIPLDTITVLAK